MFKNILGDARVSGDARVFGNAWVGGNARVSDNARVYGDAQVWGNARVWGDADISGNRDWFSFIYEGQTLTGYRSRNADGYELNIDGVSITKDQIESIATLFHINELIGKFSPLQTHCDDLGSKITCRQRTMAKLVA